MSSILAYYTKGKQVKGDINKTNSVVTYNRKDSAQITGSRNNFHQMVWFGLVLFYDTSVIVRH